MIFYSIILSLGLFFLCGLDGCNKKDLYPLPKHTKCLKNVDNTAECVDERLPEEVKDRYFKIDPIPENWVLTSPDGYSTVEKWALEIRKRVMELELELEKCQKVK